MTLGCQLTLDQLVFEHNNDILKALTNLGVQYKILFMFSDLCPAPSATAKNRYRCLQRKVELQAPLYAMRQSLTRRSLNIQDREFLAKAVSKFEAEWKKAKEVAEKLDHVEYQKKTKEQQKNIRKTLEKVDKMIAELNGDVNIQINKIYLGLTSDRDDRIIPG